MKNFNLILILTVLIITSSCQNNRMKELENQIVNLENENLKLKDSLEKYDDEKILNSTLIGIPDREVYKVNEKGNVRFGFLRYGKIKKYNVYHKIKETGEKKLLYSDLTNSVFDFEFTPKSVKDNEIEMITEFELKGGLTEVYTIIELPVVK